jgi:hypothetical protein
LVATLNGSVLWISKANHRSTRIRETRHIDFPGSPD